MLMLPIRSLWWKQPWASLMLHGKIETRTWNTRYRGNVLICSTLAPMRDLRNIISVAHLEKIEFLLSDEPTATLKGHAIAIGRLTDVYPMKPADEDKCLVLYQEGLWCHHYTDIKPINPFQVKGKQGWGIVDEDMLNNISILQSRSSKLEVGR